jgi:Putative Flp pilus-assembly TadE/G-like
VVLTRRLGRAGNDSADEGAVAVLVAIVVATVVVPLMALVVDLGLTRVLSQRSRGAADAAALAAAAKSPTSPSDTADAAAAAQALVAANLQAPDVGWSAAWAVCVDPAPLPAGTAPSPGDCISFDLTLKQVRVTVPRREVPTVFGGVLGTSPPAASATSTASWGTQISPATGACALCVLGTYAGGVEKVRVSGGDAASGGSLTIALGGGLTVTGGGVTFVSWWIALPWSVSPLPVRRAAPADPFAATLATLHASIPYGQPSSLPAVGPCAPGVYQSITNCTSFGPGSYVVTGNPSTAVTSTLNGDARGVQLFFTCSASGGPTGVIAASCPSGQPPQFRGAGSAPHTLTAPGGSGLALVFDAGLTRRQFLNSDQRLTINGDVYGPSITLRQGGTGLAVVNGRVVVGALTVSSSFGSVYPGTTMLEVDLPAAAATMIGTGAVRLVRTA